MPPSTAVNAWPLDAISFAELARELAETYKLARDDAPSADWRSVEPEVLHDLRRRVVAHRYQMELVEPLWPKFGRLWVAEAQRLRDRLGAFQDLSVLQRLHGAASAARAVALAAHAADRGAPGRACESRATDRRPPVRRAAARVPQAHRSAVEERQALACEHGRDFGADPLDHRIPIAIRALPEQPRVRIPGACVAIERPAPIRPERQQDPQRPSERAGEMRDRGIDRDARDRRARAPPRCRRSPQARRRGR